MTLHIIFCDDLLPIAVIMFSNQNDLTILHVGREVCCIVVSAMPFDATRLTIDIEAFYLDTENGFNTSLSYN